MAGPQTPKAHNRVTSVLGLLALCVLWMLGSLRSDLLPHQFPAITQSPNLARQALHFVLLALGAGLFARMRAFPWPGARIACNSAIVGITLFALPALLVHFASPWVSDLTRAALFSLVPLFAVVFEPHIGLPNQLQRKGSLIASLVAIAGTLCLIPIDEPHTLAAFCRLCIVLSAAACAAAANCLAVQVANELPGTSLSPMISIAFASAGFCFAISSALTERNIVTWHALTQMPDLTWFVVVDVPAMLLLFWLMRQMSAIRMTTRFLIAPLMTGLAGLILFQPSVTLRASLGMLLIAAGAGWLIFAPEEEPLTDTSTLKLHLD